MDWTLLAVLFGTIFGLTAIVAIIIRHKFRGNATIALTSILGIFAGIGGASHGPGELLQGNVAPRGVLIEAWPTLTVLGGEPALTLVPNLLVTGVLAMNSGLALTIWAAVSIHREDAGPVLVVLSIVMLLLGGGLFPPVFGIVAGIICLWIRRSHNNNLQVVRKTN